MAKKSKSSRESQVSRGKAPYDDERYFEGAEPPFVEYFTLSEVNWIVLGAIVTYHLFFASITWIASKAIC